MDLSTELSTDASTDLPSAFYRKERIEDMRLNQQEPEDENSVEDIESENDFVEGDEIKARFDRRLKILKRACSVLPQLRGANDLASHNQLVRIGFDRTECCDSQLANHSRMTQNQSNQEKNSPISSRSRGKQNDS